LNDNQQVTVVSDGSWQQTVLLGEGLNSFKLSAKKFLGDEVDVTEQIIYTPTGIAGGGVNNSTTVSVTTPTTTTSTATGGGATVASSSRL
jgi:type II secretory pathway component PulC